MSPPQAVDRHHSEAHVGTRESGRRNRRGMRNVQRLGVLASFRHRVDDGRIGSGEREVEPDLGGRGLRRQRDECAGPPAGFADFVSYPPLLLSGSLQGCWYTKVDTAKDNGAPSGVYLETGREVFVGRLNGGPVGVFTTTYKFESKWDPDVSTGTEVVDAASTPSWRAAEPAVSPVPPGAWTSRTSWLTGPSSIGVTSREENTEVEVARPRRSGAGAGRDRRAHGHGVRESRRSCRRAHGGPDREARHVRPGRVRVHRLGCARSDARRTEGKRPWRRHGGPSGSRSTSPAPRC